MWSRLSERPEDLEITREEEEKIRAFVTFTGCL